MPAQPARRLDRSAPGERPRRASPAPRRASPAPRRAPPPPRRAAPALRRRREELHRRRRRRDLLEDFGVALVLMTVALVFTAGLGVIALLDIALASVLIGLFVLERWLRFRRRR